MSGISIPSIPQAQKSRKWKLPRWSLVVLGGLLPALAVSPGVGPGNGVPPIDFILVGLLVPATIDALLLARLHRRRLLNQFVLLAAFVLVLMSIGYVCAWPNAQRAFTVATGVSPPSGVHDLVARYQWYDGETYYLQCVMDQAALKTVLDARPFTKDESAPSFWRKGVQSWSDWWRVSFLLASMGDRRWGIAPSLTKPSFYEWKPEWAGSTKFKSAKLVWDQASGDTWIQYDSH